MKIKSQAIHHALTHFLDNIVATMPTTGHKFLAGAMLSSYNTKIADMICQLADENDSIESDTLREMVENGFKLSGPKVSFTIGDGPLAAILKSVTINLSQTDFQQLIHEAETL